MILFFFRKLRKKTKNKKQTKQKKKTKKNKNGWVEKQQQIFTAKQPHLFTYPRSTFYLRIRQAGFFQIQPDET